MDSYNDPQPGKTYISPSFDAFNQPGRKVRIATKVIEHPDSYAFAEIKGESVFCRNQEAHDSAVGDRALPTGLLGAITRVGRSGFPGARNGS